MKLAALDVFVCPACRSDLRLHNASQDGLEILEGRLTCSGCGVVYPITRGVPRFVPTASYAQSFGRQWHWFRGVQMDSVNRTSESEAALCATTGWRDDEFPGRRLLDAGVGAGRFAERAAAKGAEVFGVDLTLAVDAAYRNIGHLSNVHLAQADIFALPMRASTFDLAYSIGVLHHTPDPPTAFARVADTLAPGGKLAVYVYARYGPGHHMSDAIRVVSTRLPLRVSWALAAGAVPLYYLYRIPVVGKACRLALPISMDPRWRWRWLDTFDWYTPTYQTKYLYPEVFRWFRQQGFEVVDLLDGPIRMSGVKSHSQEGTRDRERSDHRLVAS
ncbi:MAG TPA: methyltransferase domain-containing protein [Vicinamibacterales bacterium]|nr:methyltransferase domain-containing protein [Vicinamibacterales bacterium]